MNRKEKLRIYFQVSREFDRIYLKHYWETLKHIKNRDYLDPEEHTIILKKTVKEYLTN